MLNEEKSSSAGPEEKDLPNPQKDLPLPEKDLPLPEKELTDGKTPPKQTSTVYIKNENNDEKPHKISHILISFLFGFLFVVLIVAIGGSAFIMGKSSKPDNQQIVQTQVSAPSPTPDPTASWQKYEGNRFSFKYPNSVKVLPEDGANDINLQLPSGDIIHVIAQNNSGNLSARDWLEKEFPPSESIKFEGLSVSGKDSVQKNDYSVTHVNLNDGKILTITFVKCDGPGCGGGIDVKIFQEILSTFKFTDSAAANPTGVMVACTMEAKLCPDGVTSVGRSGPNCEFEKCPGE